MNKLKYDLVNIQARRWYQAGMPKGEGNIKGQETRAKFLEEQRLCAEENRRKLAGENRNATR